MADACKISVIVPCFNHGEFLAKTVASVTDLGRDDVEIIVIDDGSSDEGTKREVDAVEAGGTTVIRQRNQGVGPARNAGVSAARGEYIFPLDADDLLRGHWIDRGLEILSANAKVGIVYGDCEFFGAETGCWKPGLFDADRLMEENYIPVSALFRRRIWEENCGYDGTMPVQGYEDWDFWIGALERGWAFSYLPEIMFDYRRASQSMLTRAREQIGEVQEFVAKKHGGLYRRAWLNQLGRTKSVRWTSRQLGVLLSDRAKNRWQSLYGRKN